MMNSKEALENVKKAPSFMGGNPRYWTCLNSSFPFLEDINTIKQDLDKLEKLEEENQVLLVNKNVAQGIAKKFKEENDKLKKALDKACERLEDYIGNCPCGEELIEDLDCDNCDNNCKECWKKYFMKGV